MSTFDEAKADPSIDRIVAAVDFSETSAKAVAWAINLARLHNAHLVLGHTVSPLAFHLPELTAPPAELEHEVRRAAETRIQREIEGARDQGVEVEARVTVGQASSEIPRIAEEVEADVVVIGTRGLSGLKHLLLGGTAQRVVQKTRCPVLSVHPDDPAPGTCPESILAATDFSDDAEVAIDFADRLLACDDTTRLVLFHTFHIPSEYIAYGQARSYMRYRDRMQRAVERRLEEAANRLRREGRTVDIGCREGVPWERITEVAREIDASVIVMGTHGREGFAHMLLGSTAERVVQHAKCPVLTVKRPADH